MRILFICHRLPYPPNRGGKIRPFNMIRHLSRRHSVVVASLAESDKELAEGGGLRDHCTEVIAESVPKSARWFQAWKALFTRTPSSAAYFRSSRLQQRIDAAIMSRPFDLIWVHCAFVADYAVNAKGAIKVLDYGDLDSAKWFDYSQWKPWPVSWGYALEARKLRRLERGLTQHFDHFTVTAPGELEQFKRISECAPCTLIPNGVDAAYFHPHLSAAPTHPILAFVGRMDYFPNIDGILHFVKEIYPMVQKRVSGVELRIIGSNPAASIRKLATCNGIRVTGHVEDVRPFLVDATVAIAPLRIARGTQNKVLESMAMGVPVVATSQAAKGVQANPGQHLLVADEPELFASEVVKLINNADLRRAISVAARQQVENVHSWPVSMEIVDSVLAESVTGSAQLKRRSEKVEKFRSLA